MINVNQITAQLARMPDPALQRYAQMHKSDPYILSLALSESNRRKEVRAGAQMNAPEQPKVVDQAIAGMGGLPTLPADNLRGMEQSMAAGGIVAFDEGGEVPRYQYGGILGTIPYDLSKLSVQDLTRMASMGDEKAAELLRGIPKGPVATQQQPAPWQKMTRFFTGAPEGGTGGTGLRGLLGPAAFVGTGGAMATGYAGNVLGSATNPQLEGLENLGADPSGTSLAAAILRQGRENTAQKPVTAKPETAVSNAVQAAVDAATKEQPAKDGTGLRAGSGAPTLSPLSAGITGLTQTATGTAQELQNIRDQFSDALTYPQQQAIEKHRLAREGASTEGLKALEADIAKQGLGMEGAETRAKAREAKLIEREGQAAPMAMIQAGLAIMGGESPYAMTNIGRGGGLGLKAYAENIDKLELARDKLDETFSKIEAFRENRADMNAREIRAAKADIRNTKVEAEKYGLEWVMKNSEMNRADARTTFDIMSRNRLGILGLETQEHIAANRNAMYENIYGQQNKMAAEYGRLQKAVMANLEKDDTYRMASAAEKDKMQTLALAAAVRRNPFLATYGMGVGFTSAPTGGRVLKLPGDTGED